jgi:hypothetical protein
MFPLVLLFAFADVHQLECRTEEGNQILLGHPNESSPSRRFPCLSEGEHQKR